MSTALSTLRQCFRAAAIVAVAPLAALLACRVDFPDEIDIFGYDDGGKPKSDASWSGSKCTTDDDCEAGKCCGYVCTTPYPGSETDPVCTMIEDNDDALCLCLEPPVDPFCLGDWWLFEPPFAPVCAPMPYVRCAVECSERQCACDTTDVGYFVDGVAVPTCPPPDWNAVCPGNAGSDGG